MTHSPMTDAEVRIGIKPLEALLDERRHMIQRVAPLRARHGPGGTWEHMRKTNVSTIRAQLRAEALMAETKMTEAQLDEAAHADDRYVAFVAEGTNEKALWAELEGEIYAIDAEINRGQVVARFAAMERTL